VVSSRGVDERCFEWVSTQPTFVVMLFSGGVHPPAGKSGSWSEDTYLVEDGGVLDAIRWAQDHVPDGGAWAVGLVDTSTDLETEPGRLGFTFLEGYDMNARAEGLSDWEGRQLDEMVARSGTTVVLPATSTTVFPNGTAATPEIDDGSVAYIRFEVED